MRNVCMGCEERSVTCHSECEKYLAFREENLKRLDEKLRNNIARDYTRRTIDKRDHMIRRKGKVTGHGEK